MKQKRIPTVVKQYLRDIGTIGGGKSSVKKQVAASRNGSLGGRPKKRK